MEKKIKIFLTNRNVMFLLITKILLIIIVSNLFYLTEPLLASKGISIKAIGIVVFSFNSVSRLGARSSK